MNQEKTWMSRLSEWETDPEEVANTMTHGLGFLLSVLGAAALTIGVLGKGDAWRVAGCLIYAPSLVAVYAMSTLSHICSDRKLKHFFRTLDQGCIYLLIVGTFTPFSLAFLRTVPWSIFLGVMWTIAILGCYSKVFLAHRIHGVSIWIYIALGWMPIAAARTLIECVPPVGLWLLLVGGLCYTLGTAFLMHDHRVRHFHALWHLFVIAGSTCHFFAILLYVAL